MSVGDAFVVTLLVMIGVQVCGLPWMPLCQAEKQSICRALTQTAWVFFFGLLTYCPAMAFN